jgi:DNA mismatch repair protein MutS2
VNAHSLKILEFDFVLENLARRAATPYGKAGARAVLPSNSPAVIADDQAITGEARRMLEAGVGLDLGNLQDIRPALGALSAEGYIIEPLDLLQLGRHLETARRIKTTLHARRDDYPLLEDLASGLRAYRELEDRITKSIEPDGRVADRASDALFHLRREQEALRVRIYDKLESIMSASSGSIQESVVTMREGRYVIPVRADAKGQVKGIVHDSSSSGATVFMEPLASVELNNKMRQVVLAEKREVERILQEFSREVLKEIEPIHLNLELIARFDLLLAKARLAIDWNCSGALASRGRYLKLEAARHPALEDPVPLDIELGDGRNTMVITGPNTGGKTVVLKTVGLLALMNQAGLQIPAREGSSLPVFDDIFADIGDEQSISQSLSTFSSHISQIGGIVREAGEKSLVLLDEIGAGTEPSEGSALAIAILSHLNDQGCLTLSTTHYGALKSFVQGREGMINSAMEFDRQALKPTYRLNIGLPGASYGLEIASRLGLPEGIVTEARSRLDSKSIRLEELISEIEDTKRRMEQREREASDQLTMVREMSQEYQARLQGLKEELKELKQQAKQEAKDILAGARSASEMAVAAIRKEQASKESIKQARGILAEAEAKFGLTGQPEPRPGDDHRAIEGPLKIGQTVFVPSVQKEGEVVALPDSGGKVKVQVGGIRMTVKLDQLRSLERDIGQKAGLVKTVLEEERHFNSELHLLGRRAEESLELLDRYLDEAVLLGVGSVRIVHGKGGGVLRQVVKEALAKDSRVKSYRLGQWNEGQDGVTVVELK